MTRVEKKFQELKERKRTALIPYIPAGFPKPSMTVDIMHLLVKEGADLIELGVPFSDPMADGPIIQKAVEQCLEQGVTMDSVLDMVAEFRKTDADTPVIFMGYVNPVEAMGIENFAKKAVAVGLDGILLGDMPPEESDSYSKVLKEYNLNQIFLAAPTTTQDRLKSIGEKGSGFVYYVSLKGVTGSSEINIEDVKSQVARIKQDISLPVAIGFGIRDADSAYNLALSAEGVIVGSAFVSLMDEKQAQGDAAVMQVLQEKAQELRNALDRARE